MRTDKAGKEKLSGERGGEKTFMCAFIKVICEPLLPALSSQTNPSTHLVCMSVFLWCVCGCAESNL